ncbi:MAG: hypothetical protein PF503_10140 [Desulfobacula sp.]|jgi:hypothetical protein|nr:hypothetical protein [Desulfobacula sp.]
MNNLKLASEEASIVLVGSFNPAIFHPEWLLRNGLISEDDMEKQEVEIVHKDLTRFSLAWLAIQIQHDKFVARTNDPSQFIPLKDLMASIFDILEHTPINKVGMNYSANYDLSNEDDWHKVGHTLAPKDIWNETLNDPVGMTSLSVQCPRNDDYCGEINVTIGPLKSKGFGINIDVNNHIDASGENEFLNPSDILMKHWDDAISHAKKIGETTIKKAIES